MPEPVPIIEYQEDLQRSPQEVINFLQGELDSGNMTDLVVYYKDTEKGLECYVPGSEGRKYMKSLIYWDLSRFLCRFLSE